MRESEEVDPQAGFTFLSNANNTGGRCCGTSRDRPTVRLLTARTYNSPFTADGNRTILRHLHLGNDYDLFLLPRCQNISDFFEVTRPANAR